jgi:hypothetical protein
MSHTPAPAAAKKGRTPREKAVRALVVLFAFIAAVILWNGFIDPATGWNSELQRFNGLKVAQRTLSNANNTITKDDGQHIANQMLNGDIKNAEQVASAWAPIKDNHEGIQAAIQNPHDFMCTAYHEPVGSDRTIYIKIAKTCPDGFGVGVYRDPKPAKYSVAVVANGIPVGTPPVLTARNDGGFSYATHVADNIYTLRGHVQLKTQYKAEQIITLTPVP